MLIPTTPEGAVFKHAFETIKVKQGIKIQHKRSRGWGVSEIIKGYYADVGLVKETILTQNLLVLWTSSLTTRLCSFHEKSISQTSMFFCEILFP